SDLLDFVIEMYSRGVREIVLTKNSSTSLSATVANRLYNIICSRNLEVLFASLIKEIPQVDIVNGYSVQVLQTRDDEMY
ncbi:hypothetical protein PFISCL1PPCAC_28706, partial [Pristionchus fissidentatus]